MIRNSIKSRLILLMLSSYVVTAAIVTIVVDRKMMSMTDTYERTLMSDRVHMIISSLERQYQRLQQTQAPEAYEEDFKTGILRSIADQYYTDPLPLTYPVIVDYDGTVIQHPFLARGTPAPLDEQTKKLYAQNASGEIYYDFRGTKKWNYFEQFTPWRWVVFYACNVSDKYAQATKTRHMLLSVLGSLTVATCILMTIALTRVTRPIEVLTAASREIANGMLDHTIAISGSDELAVLAQTFSKMQGAVRDKLEVIATQNSSLSRLVADVEAEASERRRAEDIQRSNQRLLASTFEQSPMAMWISDDAGRPIRMNDACRSLFHIDDDADAADYCLFDDPNLQLRGLIPQIESVYRAGKAVRFLLETTTAMLSPRTTSAEQATAITLDLTVAPIKNEFGKVTNAILQHVDMTEQKRSERALRNAEQFTRSIIEQAGEAIVVYDRDFRYLSWNPFAERTTGKKAEEVLGKRSFDIFPHMQAQGVDKFLERALAGESFVSPDIHVVFDPPGKDVWLVGTYSPHRNADGEIIGVIASIRDITERRLAEQQIRDLNEKLQSKILALTQPMGDLSNIQLEDIFNIDEVQKIQDAFAKATGVASVITRPDGTPITRPGNFTHLCEHIIRKTEKGLANCYRSDAALGQRHPDGYCVQPCLSGGLWDAGTSICVGDRHIANWLIGQVLDDSIDREKMMDYAREIGADEEEFRQALAQVPHMSREQFDHVAKALHIIAKQFSTLGLQNVQQARFITERQAAEEKLRQYRDHLEEQVTQRTKELQEVHQEMVRVARQAGMAEIASGVLHNVGNVLNSVRVTTGLLRDHNDKSRSQRLTDVAQMLQAHHDDLCEFLTRDPKGQHIPTYIDKLAQHLSDENSEIGELLKTLVHHVDHISEIIAIQQQYSKAVGVTEPVDIAALVRDALSFTATSRQRHHVDVVVDCQDMPPILLDRHRVLQILLNLITNAKQALKESHADPRTVTIRATHDDTMLRISVSDNGIGFAQELHSRLFTHGFTTKKEGHGFGLHSGFLSAKEMGGSLSATSDGVGRGATFTLELPYRTAEVNHATA